MEQDRIKKLSRSLSLWLRHKPENIGIIIDKQGWTNIVELIKKGSSKIEFTIDDLKQVVEENDKQRFEIDLDNDLIRASQGHSINVDIKYDEYIPDGSVFHGTTLENIESIKKEGLISGNRQHVHLSKNRTVAQTVGSRHGKNVVILEVDARRMRADKQKLFISKNGVILTKHVDPKYIKFI